MIVTLSRVESYGLEIALPKHPSDLITAEKVMDMPEDDFAAYTEARAAFRAKCEEIIARNPPLPDEEVQRLRNGYCACGEIKPPYAHTCMYCGTSYDSNGNETQIDIEQILEEVEKTWT